MPENYVLLERIELNASAASVTFANIPQTGYTDLKVVMSMRSADVSNVAFECSLTFNGNTTGYTAKQLYGDGSVAASTSPTIRPAGFIVGTSATASTFSNGELYIPNYTSSNNKSYSVDSVTETNATTQYMNLLAGLWSNTAAITTILLAGTSGSFAQYSTFSLYGLAATGTTPVIAPKASGGNVIATDGTYWYHTFNASGTFTPAVGLTCDYLVVAGGGGGGGTGNGSNAGYAGAGGAGAGGLRSTVTATGGGGSLETALSLASATPYTVTVGAGGSGGLYLSSTSGSGSNSVFSTITSTGGGGIAAGNGANGGSGGGTYDTNGGYVKGSGTANQGFAGGGVGTGDGGTGGGGAGAVGATASGNTGSSGGAGATTSITGTSVTYAGGGGGGGAGANGGTGGSGGGAAGGTTGADPTAATVNTGGGGGGATQRSTTTGLTGSNGGSGVVIIRYTIA